MKARMKTFSMTIIFLLSTILMTFSDIPEVRAVNDSVTLRLHYHRSDDSYDGWTVWIWNAAGGDGASYDLTGEDEFGRYAEMTVPAGATELGYIVRFGEWEAKDIDSDQFISIAEVVSGTVNAYVESRVEGCTIELSEDAVTGIKISSAGASSATEITATVTVEPAEDITGGFSIRDIDGNNLMIDHIDKSGLTYTITLSEEMDLTKTYYFSYDGTDLKISMPDYYSTPDFENLYTYEGDDLGATWTAEKTFFRVWAPTADAVSVNLYTGGAKKTDDLIETISMTSDVNGTWVAEKTGDLNGTYYTYTVSVGGSVNEACDPYARTTGVNGDRAMVLDLTSTNPEGWDLDKNPNAGMKITDSVIYELHVRDFSSDASSGITNAGKFLGIIESGTKNSSGMATGLDYLKDLGITHLHLLPSYDYATVDESRLDTDQFNWGYDPKNYNVPEGSYSTDPYDGAVRVNEYKQMVQGLHEADISVVMDVVYNHVYSADNFCFNLIVPGYFSRIDSNGNYSSGSGCGNDTASERSMVRKYIVDSVKYWVEEYHVDGFRFDLVGLIDTVTINEIIDEVHATYPDVIFYGEGWTMTTSTTKTGVTLTTQLNSSETKDFAFFSDTLRDALKGSVFNATEKGYVNGGTGKSATIMSSVLGLPNWVSSPSQVINYESCHDNLTLFDKIASSNPEDSISDRVKQNNLAAAIVFTCQGTPFMQAGEEMLRTKVNEDGTFNSNSYASSSELNALKWDSIGDAQYEAVYQYYKGLIAFRKAHPALRMMSADDVTNSIAFLKNLDSEVIAYVIDGKTSGDTAENIMVIYNPNRVETNVTLPEGEWNVCINDTTAGTEALETLTGSATVNAISCMVLVQSDTIITQDKDTAAVTDTAVEKVKNNISSVVIIIVILCVIAASVVAVLLASKKNK